MSEPTDYTPMFENQVKAALAVPEPSQVFMDSLRNEFLSGASLTHKETKMKPMFSRMAWGFALLILLALILAAFSSPTVVNALRRLLGYVPGVGVVEQSTSLRVLPAPVTSSRDGVALTIEQVVAQPDKTTIVYQYVLDSTIMDRTPAPNADALPSFTQDPSLRLPDGSEIKIKLGQHLAGAISDADAAAGKSAVRYRMEFAALPQGISHIVLLLPRLIPIAPGAGPEFWEIPLNLQPSSGVEIPVIEVLPTETEPLPVSPPPSQAASTPTTFPGSHPEVSLVLDKVVPVVDGYIFMGYTQWKLPSPVPGTLDYGVDPYPAVITDVNGQEIPYDEVTPEQTEIPGRTMWAYQIKGKDFHWPLTITTLALWGGVHLDMSKDALPPPTFEFDPGANPQAGQTWALDKNFTIAGYATHISSARLVDDPDDKTYHYEFTMDSPDGAVDFSLIDLDNFDHSGSGSGGGALPDPGPFIVRLAYDAGQSPAPGPIRVGVGYMSIVFRGSWQVSWSPPGQ